MLVARKFAENSQISTSILLNFLRKGHTLRGKPPGVARTLQQRFAELNAVDPELTEKINIGFPQLKPPRSELRAKRLEEAKKNKNKAEEIKPNSDGSYDIDLHKFNQEWFKTSGPFEVREIADSYQIFDHLFGNAYFIPRLPIDIRFNYGEFQVPVYYGNYLKPVEATEEPEVTFDASWSMTLTPNDPAKSLWTLLMVSPDGHFEEEDKEYVHWLVGNIPGNDVKKGEYLAPYLQPFPPSGTGFHRFVFILFRQEKKLDLSKFKVDEPFNLKKRTWSTLEFYRELQDEITPAGLGFFQADYDESLTDFFHNKLNIKEPFYVPDEPPMYKAPQKWFPLRKAFNLYMDLHRDEKAVAKEYLQRKLAKTHPFNGPTPPLKFPNAHPITGVPSWYKTELKKARLGWGRITHYPDDIRPHKPPQTTFTRVERTKQFN